MTPRLPGARASAAEAREIADPAADDPRIHDLSAKLEKAARAERRLEVTDVGRVWLADDELAVSWIAGLSWVDENGDATAQLEESWRTGDKALRRELLQQAFDVEVGRRLPAVRQMRLGWELVRVPRWEVRRLMAIGSDGGNLLAGDGVLYTARCRHGMLIPPRRGGRCLRGCRVADALG